MGTPFRIGTRASALALWQANWVKSQLEGLWPELSVELEVIKTTGDKILNVPLSEVGGGKGLFTKEIDEALAARRVDAAVHSMKDVPFQLPHGIIFGAVPEREDARDALIANGRTLDSLPPAARIGTSSLRRQVQLRHRLPGVRISTLRGNVDTRLRKLADGEFDAIILALAGLKRLGKESAVTQILDETIMLPAVGQGALGIACRSDDAETQNRLSPLDHEPTRLAITAERGLLSALEGSCKVPVAGHARWENGNLVLKGLVANVAGTTVITDQVTGSPAKAQELGLKLGQELIRRGAAKILAEISQHGSSR
jgi:hydroxymethylbilane synthase